MKILLPVKRVIDANVQVRVRSDGSGVETANVKMAINPFDEIAVEQAVRMKEQGVASEVIAVSCGTIAAQDVLRTALAMGADRALLLQTETELQPLAVARLLAALAQREAADIVLLGKQAVDDDCNQTGQMLAALLNWPQATSACAMHMKGSVVEVVREIDGGNETVRLQLPAIITADLRLNEPRFVSLPNLMKAKKKTLEIMAAEAFGLDLSPRWITLDVRSPAPRKPGVQLADAAALVTALRNELGSAWPNRI